MKNNSTGHDTSDCVYRTGHDKNTCNVEESGYLVIRVLVTERKCRRMRRYEREDGRMGSHLDKRDLPVRLPSRKLV